jgi:uncharacterized protein YjbI with pentapeptide repeats
MIVPKRALVKPRVMSPEIGETVPLEDEIRPLVEAGARGTICIVGPPGSGKTTALEHLAAVLPSGAPVDYWDNADPPQAAKVPANRLVVFAGTSPEAKSHLAVYPLSSWRDDDAIDYLLAVHKDLCASVMARLRAAPDRDLLNGTPELWRLVLDQMAADESVTPVRAALQRFLDAQVPASAQQRLRAACLTALTTEVPIPAGQRAELRRQGCTEEALRVIRHQTVQLLLASQQVAADLHAAARCEYFRRRLPRPLVRMAGAAVAGDPTARDHLSRLMRYGKLAKQAMAASVLHAMRTGWRPEPGGLIRFSEAYLTSADWPGIRLTSAELARADLGGANLIGAGLDRAAAAKANFAHANLRGASMRSFVGSEADFGYADLSTIQADKARLDFANLQGASLDGAVLRSAELNGANLISARFRDADLSGASIMVTRLQGADFSGANLEKANLTGVKLRLAQFRGARFAGATLTGCDLEDMELPGADFRSAKLTDALLTGSAMPGADFTGADLRNTGLADINWEGVVLCRADLRGATFHMGSSRSGLVFSPFASEGTRTGFYTDDYEEQYFKNPEEIRKANLCGADLRGATVGDVDFYLVDLRGAKYDAEQEQHFWRCRAILEDRGP